MAKLLLTVAAAFFLYALSSARVPIDLSGFEVALPDPEPKTLVHSNEQPVSESAALVEWTTEKTESAESTAESGPLRTITFRPFPLRSRRGHRCRRQHRQNHIHQLMPGDPRFPDSEVPYGNDMIVSHEEKSGFDPEFGGEGRQMSASTDQVGPRFHHEDWDVEKRSHKKKRHFRHVDREDKEREDEDEDDDEEEEEEERKEQKKKKHQRYTDREEREREDEGDHDHDHDEDDDEERREHKKQKHHHRYADREEDEHEDKHDHDDDRKHRHFHGYKHRHFHGYKREHEHEHEGGFMKTISKFLNLF